MSQHHHHLVQPPMTPLPSHTSESKKRQALSQHDDLLHESGSESAEETLLDQDQFDSSSSSPFPSSFNSPERQKVPGILSLAGEIFYAEAKKLTIEDNKKVQVFTLQNTQQLVTPIPNHFLLWANLILIPSKFTFMRILLYLITHLKLWINHVILVTPPTPLIVYESSSMSPQDDHILQLDSSIPSFQLQDTSSVEIEFFPDFDRYLDHGYLSETDVFLEHHDYEQFLLNPERLIHHLTISPIRKVIIVTSYAKMTHSSLMPQTLV